PGRLVDQRVVLHLAGVTQFDTRADVGAAADDAVRADACPLTHLRQMPHPGTGADARLGRDVGGRFDDGGIGHGRAPSRYQVPQPGLFSGAAGTSVSTSGTIGKAGGAIDTWADATSPSTPCEVSPYFSWLPATSSARTSRSAWASAHTRAGASDMTC